MHIGLPPKSLPEPKETDDSPQSGNALFNNFLGVFGIKSQTPKSPSKSPTRSPTSTPKNEPFTKSDDFFTSSKVSSKFDEYIEESKQRNLTNICIPEDQKREPELLQIIKSKDEKSKNSDHTFQWTCKGKFLIRTSCCGNISVWLIDFDKKYEKKVKIESISTSKLDSGWPKTNVKSKITSSCFAVDRHNIPKLVYGFGKKIDKKINCFFRGWKNSNYSLCRRWKS